MGTSLLFSATATAAVEIRQRDDYDDDTGVILATGSPGTALAMVAAAGGRPSSSLDALELTRDRAARPGRFGGFRARPLSSDLAPPSLLSEQLLSKLARARQPGVGTRARA